MPFLIEKLIVYQKGLEFVDAITESTQVFPRGQYYLADQLNRAALSIVTNLAEGNGRYSKADRANFFRISRGSCFECVPLLEMARRKRLLSETQHEEFYRQLEQISRMLSGLLS